MNQPVPMSAREAREKTISGQAMLVCAYEDDAKCRSVLLEGAMTLTEFLEELPGLDRDQEIIFYCA